MYFKMLLLVHYLNNYFASANTFNCCFLYWYNKIKKMILIVDFMIFKTKNIKLWSIQPIIIKVHFLVYRKLIFIVIHLYVTSNWIIYDY